MLGLQITIMAKPKKKTFSQQEYEEKNKKYFAELIEIQKKMEQNKAERIRLESVKNCNNS